MTSKVSFRCPQTGTSVEQLIADANDSAPDEFWPVRCAACGKMHFVNRTTGLLLGSRASR